MSRPLALTEILHRCIEGHIIRLTGYATLYHSALNGLRFLMKYLPYLITRYVPQTCNCQHEVAHHALPPFTSKILPLTYLASSLNKNATTSATSSAVPILPIPLFSSCLLTASPPATTPAFVGVSI